MAIGSRNKVSTNFSLSSMTDIVFLLLIFFIILSTLVTPNALDVDPPISDSKSLGKQTVSVSISPDISYWVGTDEVAIENLESVLIAALTGEPEPGIILHSDKTVPIEHVIEVMEIANRNKFELVLATKTE